jgi:hypothetical protein
MAHVTVSELLILDKKSFEKEYYEWQESTLDYKWWDNIYEDFKVDCEELSVYVDDITFSVSYSQGDSAAFRGKVYLPQLMERKGLDVKYPALYLGVKDDNSFVFIRYSGNNCMRVDDYRQYANQTAPSGVFSDLDQQSWEELIDEQDSEAGLEEAALEFANDLADGLYRTLRAEYEYLTSEESFIASCEYNEITFEINTEEEAS